MQEYLSFSEYLISVLALQLDIQASNPQAGPSYTRGVMSRRTSRKYRYKGKRGPPVLLNVKRALIC